MKKVILLFVAVSFITMATITATKSFSKDKVIKTTKSELNTEKYKACIEACNACMTSCKKVGHICKKNEAMADCGKLGKECVTSCKNAIEFMNANSILVKSKCLECANICEKHATECDKFDMADCKKHATDCRKAAKLFNEL